MESSRFGNFVLKVEGISKAIRKIKLGEAPKFGLKGVHLFWLCELLKRPDGIAASELAEISNINRSLISRELTALHKSGYITTAHSGKHGYNAKLTLTRKGIETANRINDIAIGFQNRASCGISEDELASFYSTLDKIYSNLSRIAEEEAFESADSALPEKEII